MGRWPERARSDLSGLSEKPEEADMEKEKPAVATMRIRADDLSPGAGSRQYVLRDAVPE